MNKKLHNTIMRRVYYAYALRVGMNPTLLHGLLMFVVLLALTKYVSLGNVINNLMNVELGRLVSYMVGSVLQTEVWTLLLVGMFIFAALSLRIRLNGDGNPFTSAHA